MVSTSRRRHAPALAKWTLALAAALVGSTMIGSSAMRIVSAQGPIKEYALPAGNPIGITTGSDGNVWFTTSDAELGRITRSGEIVEFTIPQTPPCTTNCPAHAVPCAPDCLPQGREITTGPDGNLWFTQPFSDYVARAQISTNGVSFTEYPAPTGCGGPLRFCLDGITTGPDGNLWFSEPSRHQIGRLTPASGAIAEFPGAGFPERITLGPDGNLWFGDPGAGGIGRITIAGLITEFPFPNPELSHGGPAPNPDGDADAEDFYSLDPNGGIAAGSDGNLWAETAVFWGDVPPSSCPVVTNDDLCSGFGYYLTSQWMLAISPIDGTVEKEFRLPNTQGNPQDLARGSDGNIWIPMPAAVGPSPWEPSPGMQVSSLSPTGSLTTYATDFPHPYDITAGPHQTMWFTEQGHIGRIQTCGDDCGPQETN